MCCLIKLPEYNERLFVRALFIHDEINIPLLSERWFLSLGLNLAYKSIAVILKLQRMKMLRDGCLRFNMVNGYIVATGFSTSSPLFCGTDTNLWFPFLYSALAPGSAGWNRRQADNIPACCGLGMNFVCVHWRRKAEQWGCADRGFLLSAVLNFPDRGNFSVNVFLVNPVI